MSSLRVDDGRSGRSGRSHSKARDRSRSKDARAPASKPLSSARKRVEVQDVYEPEHVTASMPGAFEPEEPLQYGTRKTSAVTPEYSGEVRSPYVVEMPFFPEDDYDDVRYAGTSYNKYSTTSSVPSMPASRRGPTRTPSYPLDEPGMPRTPQYPDDMAGRHTNMPYAQYDMPQSYHYSPPTDMKSSSKYANASERPTPAQPFGQPQSPTSPLQTSRYSYSAEPGDPRSRLQSGRFPYPGDEDQQFSPPSPEYPLCNDVQSEHVRGYSFPAGTDPQAARYPTESRYPSSTNVRNLTSPEQGRKPSSPVAANARSPMAPLDPSYSTNSQEAKTRVEIGKRFSTTATSNSKSEIKSRNLTVNEPQERAPSPGLRPRMDRLSVSGNRPDMQPGKAPPASPLLEAYRGTYQSISPMPSPIMLPAESSELDDLPPLSPSTSLNVVPERRPRSKSTASTSTTQPKRAKIYDATSDAETLLDALNHRSGAKLGPLIAVLPPLTHDQLLLLRSEYKRRYKVAGHGVNIAKHIKVKTTGNLGKACYAVALGRWESDAYWANFWYQSHASGRELLIETLMGRSNAEVRAIKEAFKDKRYGDSLARCMEKELKPDKFRKAVLMALEERRQEETEVLPREVRDRDVAALYEAVQGRAGGESAIIDIVVRRSDAHLREVLRTYEQVYESNFAREALKKSNNLVGELLAHILNGVINRPLRDALLLHHALADIAAHNASVQLRHELLISRLVRLHWDRGHLGRVREEFARRYGVGLEAEVDKACKGEYGEFCVRLCET